MLSMKQFRTLADSGQEESSDSGKDQQNAEENQNKFRKLSDSFDSPQEAQKITKEFRQLNSDVKDPSRSE